MKRLFTTFLLIVLIGSWITAVSHHSPSSLAAVDDTAVSTSTAFFFDSGQLLSDAGNGVALGDLNGSGYPDIFIARNGPDTVWFNDGNGSYVDSDQSLGSGWSLAVALGDLDGDGDLDAVVVADSNPSLVITFNQGGAQGGTPGHFLPGPQAIGGDLATSVALGDLNGNGHLDIFLTRHIGRPSQVWFNDGTGTFSDSGQSLTSSSQAVALADFDGDGDLDAVVADGDMVRLLWNMGGDQGGTEGVFTDSGQSLATPLSLDLAVGDLDGDGDLDLVIATMNGGILTWINQGGAQGGTPGQFAPGTFPTGPTGNRAIALGDLDNDGDLDIFVARSGGNMVWLNQGGQQGGTEGLFTDSGQQLGDLFSESIALVDVDGDGDLDAVVANFDGPTQVWLNAGGPPSLNPDGWQVQLADTRGQTGLYPGLTLDENGRPHVSYVTSRLLSDGAEAYDLMYAFWDGRRWQRQLVDRNDYIGRHLGDVVANTAIALDSNGRPHIAYVAGNGPFGWADQNLKYARWTGNAWQVELVDDNDDTHPHISLAIDSQNRPHVSYAVQQGAPFRYTARYAVRTEHGWQLEEVDALESGDVGQFSSIALDSSDVPHISYADEENNQVKYARKVNGDWQTEAAAGMGVFLNRGFTSLALDELGRPHISFISDAEQQLRYTAWNGSGWQVQTVYESDPFATLTGQTGLALDDEGRPHITFVERSSPVEQLRYAHWDGATWQVETVDDKGQIGRFNSMALGSDNAPHVAYYDARFGDLRLAHWGPNWVHGPVDESGVILAPSLALADQTPAVGYYNQSSGQVKGALWNGAWEIAPVASVSNEVTAVSLATSLAGQHMSYYDADTQNLVYAVGSDGQWTKQVVDAGADVGRYNRLLLVRANSSNPGARIAYWDATSWRIKLALRDPGQPFQVVTNLAGPPLNSNSGPLDITLLSGGQIGVSYYDAVNGALRLATWQPGSQTWSDELITSAVMGAQRHALQTDATTAQPVVAFYDAAGQAIRYTYRTDDGWIPPQTAVANVAQPTSLDMVLGFESLDRPRLLFTTEENRLYLAHRQAGPWQIELVAEADTSLGNASLALGDRPFLAYTEGGSLQLAHRAATLDVTSATNPERTGGEFNVLDACAALVNFFFEARLRTLTGFHNQPQSFAQEPLPEPVLFAAMHGLFAGSAGGNHYINAYAQHGAEMGQIGLQDPALMWDAYGTLQNFLPGLEALATGQGDQFVVTQEMVDDALDIWQRLAAAGSPALAATINSHFA